MYPGVDACLSYTIDSLQGGEYNHPQIVALTAHQFVASA